MTSYVGIEECMAVYYVRDVKNAVAVLRAMTESGNNRNWTACDVQAVWNTYHIKCAALKAIIGQSQNRLKTKVSWHAEVLYQLSPSTNISEALRQYGINENTTEIAFVIYLQDHNHN